MSLMMDCVAMECADKIKPVGCNSPALSTRAPSSPVRSLWLGSDGSDGSDSSSDSECADYFTREADHAGVAIVADGLFEIRVPLLAFEALPAAARSPSDDESDDSFFNFTSGRKIVPSMMQMAQLLESSEAPLEGPETPSKLPCKKRSSAALPEPEALKPAEAVTSTPSIEVATSTSTTSSSTTTAAVSATPPKRRRVILSGGVDRR